MIGASVRTLIQGAVVTAVVALTVGAALAKPDGTSTMPSKRGTDYEVGKRLWTQSCWQCHGESGKGDGPAAAALPGGVPTLEGKVRGPEFERLIAVIQAGRGAMPAYSENIDDRDSRRILEYVRSRLEGEPPPPPEPKPEGEQPSGEGQ